VCNRGNVQYRIRPTRLSAVLPVRIQYVSFASFVVLASFGNRTREPRRENVSPETVVTINLKMRSSRTHHVRTFFFRASATRRQRRVDMSSELASRTDPCVHRGATNAGDGRKLREGTRDRHEENTARRRVPLSFTSFLFEWFLPRSRDEQTKRVDGHGDGPTLTTCGAAER